MTTSARQDKDFIEAMIAKRLLEEAIQWIGSNLAPEEVFDEEQLRHWAESHDYERVE